MADSPSELQLEIEKLERKHAEHPEGRFFVPLANAYRKMGDIETAEALLRSGVERHPDYLSAHIVLGRCLADRGAVGEAEDEFRFVLTQDPQNLIALRTLGELAVADGRPGEAAEWYRELLAVDPMNEDARQALDSLADAPAPELESEFRSGAGWWDPAADAVREEEPAESSTQPGETAPPDGFSATDELFPTGDEPVTGRDSLAVEAEDGVASQGEPAEAAGAFPESGDELSLTEEPGASAEYGTGAADDSYAWGGYDDLPGLRSGEPLEVAGGAAADVYESREPSEDEEPVAAPPSAEEPEQFTSFATAAADEEADEGTRFSDEGSSEVVTETIAELYARQGLHERAAAVYRELIRRRGGDPALEQRLAEIERLERAEEAGEPEPVEAAPDLAFADEEALLSDSLEAQEEDDTFASSFADGFTTVYEEDFEPALDETEPHASFPDVGAAEVGEGPGETAERFDEHPLPELAPPPAKEEPEMPAPAAPSGASIVHFLADLAAWRPAGAATAVPTARPAEEPPPLGDQPEATATWDAAISPEEAAGIPSPEGWSGEPVGGDQGAGPGVAEPWETATVEPGVDAHAEPWDSAAIAEDEAAADLPYLEEVADSTPAGGTGPAEDEPFPWELPGAASRSEGAAPVDRSPGELDPFFVDDVEPASMRADEPLPEAAPAPEARREPEPEVRSAQVEQTEDEDLESFQAWLRSLKR